MKLTPDPFHFAVSVVPGPNTLITVTGDLDLASTPAFEAAVSEIELGAVRHAVLDLERLDFMDAVGLRAVLALNAKCDSASAKLTIRPGPRHVQRVFELTGTGRELKFNGDESDRAVRTNMGRGGETQCVPPVPTDENQTQHRRRREK